MARTDAATDLTNARADLVLALADLTAGDSVYKMVDDLIQRLDMVIVKNQNPAITL